MIGSARTEVRPPIGGWPKTIRLEDGESFVKWDGSLHDRPGFLETPYWAGTLYLTNKRLLFNPIFLVPLGKVRSWNLEEISDFGNNSRPTLWRRLFRSHMNLWEWPFFIEANNETHYFHTTRDDEWLDALAKATGLTPRRRNA
jgi:hypothetical protein